MTDLRTMVFAALDNALAGGHFGPGEQCELMAADGLANDMVAFDDDLCDRDPAELEPFAREWMIAHGINPNTGEKEEP